MSAILLAILAQSAADTAKAAVETTAGTAYTYKVAGRFERSGEWLPAGVLAARIKVYQSARYEDQILVKGPEGLWKTPKERIGEATEKEQPDVADMMKVLEEARAPHKMAAELLAAASKVAEGDRARVEDAECRVYWLSFPEKRATDELKEQIDLDVKRGRVNKPDEIVWSSMNAKSRIYARVSDGCIARLSEESSVKIAYKRENQRPDEMEYKLKLTLDLSGFGQAKLDLPVEVKERLGLKKDEK